MGICVIVAAAVLNCTPAQALTPAEAVRVLTSNTRPVVAPLARVAQDVRPVPHNPAWPFLTPATPIAPLAPPWSVTYVTGPVYGGYGYGEPLFNGRPFSGQTPRPTHTHQH